MKIDWKGEKKVSSTDCLSSSVGEDGAGGDLKGFALRRRGLRDKAAVPRGGPSGEICALVNLNLSQPWLPHLLWEHRILAGTLRNPYQYTRTRTRSCSQKAHTRCLHTHARNVCTHTHTHAQNVCMHMHEMFACTPCVCTHMHTRARNVCMHSVCARTCTQCLHAHLVFAHTHAHTHLLWAPGKLVGIDMWEASVLLQ